jgi:hypothetical protein
VTIADEARSDLPLEVAVYAPESGESPEPAKRLIDEAKDGLVMVVQVKAPFEELERKSQLLQWILQQLFGRQRILEQLVETLTPQHEPPSPAALLQARRNAQARKQLLDEFGALKGVEVADHAGSTAENRSATANRWRHEGRILGVRYQDAIYYPGFQFADDGQPLPAIRAVLEVLTVAGLSPWEIALWFATRTSALDDGRPIDLLANDPDAVIEAARREIAPISG